jgi:hypothetical protein
MNKAYRVSATSLILIVLLSTPTYAWNNRGHMMVAAVAYRQLNQQTRNRVDALLLLNPDRPNWLSLIPQGTPAAKRKMMLFMIAATWPDRIKGDSQYHSDGPNDGNTPPDDPSASQNIGYDDLARHKYWHFINVPFAQDNTPLPTVVSPNAKTQLTAFRAVLASTTSSDKLKSYDLSWLLHLVGDLHQPLHCTARVSAANPKGDAGGNFVKLNGALDNLHSFWDGIIGGGNEEDPVPAANVAATLPAAPPGAAADLNVQHWIQQGVDLAKTMVYVNPPIGKSSGPFTTTSVYRNNARKLVKRRIALGGARLARILNSELK